MSWPHPPELIQELWGGGWLSASLKSSTGESALQAALRTSALVNEGVEGEDVRGRRKPGNKRIAQSLLDRHSGPGRLFQVEPETPSGPLSSERHLLHPAETQPCSVSSCRKSPSSPLFPLGSCMAVASAALSLLLAALREWDSVSSVVGMTFCVPLGRCDWFRESLSCGVGLSCLRQQLPRPQAVCGLLWHLSLGQSMIYNKMVGPCGTLKGCGHGRLRGKGQHTGRTLDCKGPVPTSSLPQPSL